MSIRKKLISIDQFGAVFSLAIQGNDTQYKSISGALATIFIYFTAIFYFVYLILQWSTNQLLPTITTIQRFKKEGSSYHLNTTPFFYNMESYDTYYDELMKGKRIFDISTDFFLKGEEFTESKYQPICKDKFDGDLFDSICVDTSDKHQQTLQQDYSNRSNDSYLGYLFYQCDSADISCVSGDDANDFLSSQSIYSRITTFTQEYDLKTFSFETIPFDFYYFIHPQTTVLVNLYVTVKQMKISRGLIFPSEETLSFISNIEVTSQTIPRKNDDPLTSIWLSLKRIEIEEEIEYPTFPDVMSQFTFIFSGLMTFGLIFSYFNNHKLMEKIINQLGEIYFWDYSTNSSGIKKNLSKKNLVHSLTNLTTTEFIKIETLLYSKCNLLNLIYEISKLQLAIQTILSKEQLEHIQNMKYSLNNHQGEQNEKHSHYILSLENFKVFLQNSIPAKNLLFHHNDLNFQERILNIITANNHDQQSTPLQVFGTRDLDKEQESEKQITFRSQSNFLARKQQNE